MAANSPVGQVTAMKLITHGSNERLDTETTLTGKRIMVNPDATYQQVDTLARALAALSRNTYIDTDLITVISVNEQVAG